MKLHLINSDKGPVQPSHAVVALTAMLYLPHDVKPKASAAIVFTLAEDISPVILSVKKPQIGSKLLPKVR